MSKSFISRTVAKSVQAVEQGEGVGVTVRRSIGTPRLRNLSPFLMLDHFKIGEGSGFAEHPHRGQATVTYMLDGQVQHEDFRDHKGVIGPGDVQWMQVGRGMVHSEMPIHGPGLPDPIGLQLWVDLPKANKLDEPDYQELKHDQMPIVHPAPGVDIKIISGKAKGSESEGTVESPVRAKGGCWFLDIRLSNIGSKATQQVPVGWTSFAYILEGSVKFGGEKQIERFHTVVLTSGSNETGVDLEAASAGTRVILIAGEPLDQEVVQHGPFVMDTREGIQQAFFDYSTASNGFEGAHDWSSKSAAHLH